MLKFTLKNYVQKTVPVFSIAAMLAMAISAKAQLAAYEGFNYTAGSGIAGQSGGTGWESPWASGGGFVLGTNVATGLNYTDANGNTLQTSGGSLIVGFAPSGTTASPQRALANGIDSYGTNELANGTYWISFLAQWVGPTNSTAPSYAAQGGLGLYSGVGVAGTGGTERFDVGGVTTSGLQDNWTAWNANAHTGAANASPATAYPPSVNYSLNNPNGATFVLMELVAGPTNNASATLAPTDSLYIWFNWTNLLVAPDISTAIITDTNEALLADVNALRLAANNFNATRTNAVINFDEIRVGLGALDVMPTATPEPSTMALAAVGGLALLALRRKRQ